MSVRIVSLAAGLALIAACGSFSTEGDWAGATTPTPTPSGTGTPTPTPTPTATPTPAAELVVNEVLVDVGSADANRDGMASITGDQFVEIVNIGNADAALAGITIHNAGGAVFTFGAVTLPPGKAVAVFGNGTLSGAGACNAMTFATTSGSLAFVAPGSVTVKQGETVLATYSWSTLPSSGESKTRKPDGTGTFEDHGAVTIDGLTVNVSPGCKYQGGAF